MVDKSACGVAMRGRALLVAVPLLLAFLPGAAVAAPDDPTFTRVSPDAVVGGGANVGPRSVALGDLDGDGRTDAVTANAFANSISVLRGTAGGFSSPSTDFPVGDSPQAVEVADVDGDGLLDVVTANSGADTVSLLRGAPGGGLSRVLPDVPVGAMPESVALGDIDGDRDIDIVTANAGAGTVSVLLAGPGGTYTRVLPERAVGASPVSVAVADLDGDGRADIVTANARDSSVSVLRQFVPLPPASGDFQQSSTAAVGQRPQSVAVGDLDADGDLDLVTANNGDDTISVVRSATAGGSQTFTADPPQPVGDGPVAVAIAKIDGDPIVDLVTANGQPETGPGNTLSLLRGTGNGGFRRLSPDPQVGAGASDVAAGDVTGDGLVDVVSPALFASTVAVVRQNTVTGGVRLDINRRDSPGGSVRDAFISVCRVGTATCVTRTSDASGAATVDGLVPGDYRIEVQGPGDFRPAAATVRVDGGRPQPVLFLLVNPMPPPAGTTLGTRTSGGGVPVVVAGQPAALRTQGCDGGPATFQVLVDGQVIQTGSLVEDPPGTYSATLTPTVVGPAQVRLVIDGCPQVLFDIYIDPSGTVRVTDGTPLAGAAVTLLRSDTADGQFAAVPDGSTVLSPSNRRNPDASRADGRFGWDVGAGFYKVLASRDGCRNPADASDPDVETKVLQVPPAVIDLDLRLDCSAQVTPAVPEAPVVPLLLVGAAGVAAVVVRRRRA